MQCPYNGENCAKRSVATEHLFSLDIANVKYIFFRFAIELNEVLESEKHLLPITDTRFRPDQRYLEVNTVTKDT